MRQFLPLPLLALLLLAACAETPTPPVPAPAPEPSLPAPSAAPAPVPSPPAPTKPAAKPPARTVTPEELIGLDRAGVETLLGDPQETSLEAGARLLTYRAKDCALSVILFFDVKTATERVLSYELSPPRRAKSCYTTLRGGR